MFKLNGLVQLPLGINFTGTFEARAGYIIHQHDEVYAGSNFYNKDVVAGNEDMCHKHTQPDGRRCAVNNRFDLGSAQQVDNNRRPIRMGEQQAGAGQDQCHGA